MGFDLVGGGGAEEGRKEKKEKEDKAKKEKARKSGHGVPCPYENQIPRWK
jgi:hypothetical protein